METPGRGRSDRLNRLVPLLYDDDFELYVQAGPVVVLFTATQSPICQAFEPTFQSMAAEFTGQVRFFMVDVDRAPEVVKSQDVDLAPTVVYYNSLARWCTHGISPKDELRTQVVRLLLGKLKLPDAHDNAV